MQTRKHGVRAQRILGLILASWGCFARADNPPLVDTYGFRPLEIYKLNNRLGNLLIADLDGDKIADIAVANNARSRIDMLLSTPGPSESEDNPGSQANQVKSSARMRLKSIPVNKEVVSIAAGDFDADGVTDLAFYGTPAELVILRGSGKGDFQESRRLTSGTAIEAPTALNVGDLNQDGRHDLILITPNEILSFLQSNDGRLAEPERLPHTASRPSIFKVLDLDGDGGDDLIILDSGNDQPIRVRFSAADGTLGPEERFAIESPRAIAFAKMDNQPGHELLMVEGQSGRVKVLTLRDDQSDNEPDKGRLLFYPLPAGETRNRSLAMGDVDGNGKTDVVITDPANAQLLLYLQDDKMGLVSARNFPNLAGARGVSIADLDGDGTGEVVVLSEQEKAIASSKFREGRLSFPAPLPIQGEPVALETGDLDNNGKPEILYIARAPRGAAESFVLKALRRNASGNFEPYRWGETDSVAIDGLSGIPPALRLLDVNQDGNPDILIFKPFGSPILLLGQGPANAPVSAGGNLGPLVAATPAGISRTAPGDAALLVSQNAFARSVLMGANGQWDVKDQFNSGRSNAQIIGAAALDLNADGSKEVVLFDRASRSLLFLNNQNGVYRPAGTLSVGAFDFQGIHVADLDGDGRDDLLLAGSDRFGVVTTGRKGRKFEAIASYDTTRKDAILGDLIAGDINGDGKPDIVVTDIGENALELLAFDGASKLERALAFKIFEAKSFRERDRLVEPREIGLGDVDGDNLTDIVLICHDRILVYLQDDGSTSSKTTQTQASATSPPD